MDRHQSTAGKLLPHTMDGAPLAMTAMALLAATAFAAPALAQAVDQAAETQQVITLPQVEVRDTAEKKDAGTTIVISGPELEQAGGIADIVRYQPLVSAPGTASGATRGRSNFERGGTTGYNIRGIEGNRVGMDVDGVEMPDATTRPYASRAGTNTFGVGRDFMDPEMYSLVGIDSGTTTAKRAAGGIGGAVSFRTKSASDFLRNGKTSYFDGKLGYDGTDRSWHKAVTAAGRSGDWDGLITYSRRDGHEGRNNSDTVDSTPEKWHSNALLLKGGLRVNAENYLQLAVDIYSRRNENSFFGWDANDVNITESSEQANKTDRRTVQLSHLWTPAWVDSLDTRVYFQETDTRDDTDTTTLASGAVKHNMSQNKTRTVGFSSTGAKHIERHLLSFGVNFSQQRVERPWSVIDGGAKIMKPQPDSTTAKYGVFFRDDIGFEVAGRALTVTPGLRVDTSRSKPHDMEGFISGRLSQSQAEEVYAGTMSNTIVSPSLSVAYALRPQFFAYAQYKHSGRAPGPGEVYGSWNMDGGVDGSPAGPALLGNKDLKPEKSDALELGLKGSPTPGVTLNTSMFYTRYQDFIGFTRYTRALHPDMFVGIPSHRSQIYRAENRDEATIYGFELFSRLEHGTWTPALKGLYSTWGVGISRGHSISNYAGDKKTPLETVLPRKAVIGVGYDAPQKQWGFNLVGTFVAGKQAKETNRESYTNAGTALTESAVERFRVPGYGIFDLSTYWRINKNIRLNAGVYNLTNKRYWDYSSARRLQPSVPRDQRDMELLTSAGRTAFVSMHIAF